MLLTHKDSRHFTREYTSMEIEVNEKYSDFHDRFRNHVSILGISEENACSDFIKKLPHHVRREANNHQALHAFSAQPFNLNRLMEYIELQFDEDDERSYFTEKKGKRDDNERKARDVRKKEERADDRKRYGRDVNHEKEKGVKEGPKLELNPDCWNCDTPGHKQPQCRKEGPHVGWNKYKFLKDSQEKRRRE
ncbi:hypothetical protein AKO1_004469, partial [Acrasis kona]